MRVYLTGFMGAGKTTVGRLLAERLEAPFVDLDAAVEAAAGCPVAEIFALHGEAEFRRLEAEALRRTGELERCVVAVGGGGPVHADNRAWMREHGRVVWLDAPLASLRRRLGPDPGRPLWGDETAVAALYAARLPAYRDCHLRVAADGPSPTELAARIAAALR